MKRDFRKPDPYLGRYVILDLAVQYLVIGATIGVILFIGGVL